MTNVSQCVQLRYHYGSFRQLYLSSYLVQFIIHYSSYPLALVRGQHEVTRLNVTTVEWKPFISSPSAHPPRVHSFITSVALCEGTRTRGTHSTSLDGQLYSFKD